MREPCILLTDDDDRKLAAKADKMGIVNDLELAEKIIHEWLNIDDSARLTHREK